MKKMKKLLSMLLAVVMVLAMAAPSFAEEHNPKTDIIIQDEVAEGTQTEYKAYKLLDASNGTQTVKDPETGELKTEEIYAYSTVNNKYKNILKEITEKTTDKEIIEYISKLNGENIRTFADAVYKGILRDNLDAEKTTVENNKKFTDMDQGYYLIADTSSFSGKNDTNSLVMLDTAGRSENTIKVKKSAPTVDKKIVKDGSELDTADATRNEEILYRLIGTLPSDYATYKEYFYKFTDTLDTGLVFVTERDGVKIENPVTVKIIDKDNKEHAINDLTPSIEGQKLTVTFSNLKNYNYVDKDSKIIVEYYAKLASDNSVVIGGAGNKNGVKVEYSNNPYADENGTTGTTPETYVEVFTYQLSIAKKNGNNEPLPGAGFTISKFNSGNWIPVQEISGVDKNNEIDTNLTTFEFKQLGAGTYKIEETTVPDGYNKAADIEFTLKAVTTQDKNNDMIATITSLELENVKVGNEPVTDIASVFTVAKNSGVETPTGVISTTIVNNAGTELPSTGGIGTTIFYAVGIILMAGAVFFVVRRKRA